MNDYRKNAEEIMQATMWTGITPVDAWKVLLDMMWFNLDANLIIDLIQDFSREFSVGEQNRAYLHRQRELNRMAAKNKVVREGGTW